MLKKYFMTNFEDSHFFVETVILNMNKSLKNNDLQYKFCNMSYSNAFNVIFLSI